MSYIIKESSAFINAKLTDYGRKQLASGKLDFTYYSFGDSEIDYQSFGKTFDFSLYDVLRPKDDNPDIRYPIKPTSTSSDQFKSVGALTPIKSTITNVATTRGFFSGTTDNFTARTDCWIQGDAFIYTSAFTGTNIVSVNKGPSYVSGSTEPSVGDLMLIKYKHPYLTDSQNRDDIESNPTPYLWYQILEKTGNLSDDTLSLTLDRSVADFSSFSALTQYSWVKFYPGGDAILNYYGSGTTIPYWNELTLSFDNTCDLSVDDVKVWNMNIPFTEEIAGIDESTYLGYENFGSTGYTGTKEYYNLTSGDTDKKSIAIIHYTNNVISNVYGEKFYLNTPVLSIPTIMWHGRTFSGSSTANEMGIRLDGDSTEKFITSPYNLNSVIPYYDLTDPDDNVVGKIFPNHKMFVIEDEEMVAALSYKSNRNWSLPQISLQVETTSEESLLDSFEEIYVTYLFDNLSGYTTSLHCQKYSVADRNNSTSNVQVAAYFDAINGSTFPYMTDGSNGFGWQADNFYIICQKVVKGERPDPTAWKIIDYTTSLLKNPNNTINPILLENSVFEITYNAYTGATTYDLSTYLEIPLITSAGTMNFGDEVFFYGNVDTSIAATTYKTTFLFAVPPQEFNESQNPTWVSYSATTSPNIHISEVGVYDALKNLVAIGKISSPIEKHPSKTIVLELSVDF